MLLGEGAADDKFEKQNFERCGSKLRRSGQSMYMFLEPPYWTNVDISITPQVASAEAAIAIVDSSSGRNAHASAAAFVLSVGGVSSSVALSAATVVKSNSDVAPTAPTVTSN